MQVFCLTSLDELVPYAEDWDRLAAGMPSRSWNWLSTWWRHYGAESIADEDGPQLSVLCVFDPSDDLVGVAPWYIDRSATHGRALRSLGFGEIGSRDPAAVPGVSNPGILCRLGCERSVADVLADYLAEPPGAYDPDHLRWDLLELTNVAADDSLVGRLVRSLTDRGAAVHNRPGASCWRIELPATWDPYVQTLSPNRSEQVHRLEQEMLASGRAVLRSVDRIGDLSASIDMLVDWQRPMPHESSRSTAFDREVLPCLLRAGQLQLHRLEIDGHPVAIEVHLTGGGIVHVYRSVVDPEASQRQPDFPLDRLATLATLRRAIEQGYRAFDLSSGDESQKAFWHAEPRATVSVEMVPDRPTARWRHHLCLAGSQVKQWLQSSLHSTVEQGS